MSTRKLIRWSGLASLLAGVLYFLAVLIHPAGEDAASMLLPAWVPAHALGAVAALFMLLGLVGLYARQVEKTGWPGLLGFILAFIGTAILGSEEFQAATLLPIIASKAPTLIEESATSSSALIFALVLLVSFVGGFLLFGIAVMRAGVLPRWSGLVLIIGLLLSFGGAVSHVISIIAAAVFGSGLAWMGYALWSSQGEAISKDA